MILQALAEYYGRKTNSCGSDIAPLGWERKDIPFLLVLSAEGKLIDIQDTREKQGKKTVAKAFLVPQSVKRTVGIAANLLWDNTEYVFGIPCKDPSKMDRARQAHQAFLSRLSTYSDIPSVKAVQCFLAKETRMEDASRFPAWEEIREKSPFLSFAIAGQLGPVFSDPAFQSAYDASLAKSDSSGTDAICLVTGERDAIAATHSSIQGVVGANTTGGNIVSFNFDAACSFGKKQGNNAPVGERAVFAYTTALNTLLGKGSRQKVCIGDATVVFWASRNNIQLEDDFLDFLDCDGPEDNPDLGVAKVETLLKSVHSGSFFVENDDARFYVLGLAPNSARLAIRFWHDGTVAEMAKNFADYFEDLRIAHGPKYKDHLSLKRLLLATAPQGKAENIIPNLSGAIVRSILEGLPFPETLLQAVLMRIKADHDLSYPRAKLLKGYLNRKIRFHQLPNERMLTVSLDKENTNIGYRLGRLFAVLENIQSAANPGINATIRDKYYASASATPGAVFGTLVRLSQHHLSKIGQDMPGLKVNMEKLLGEVCDDIGAFPAHLSMTDQAQFALGYYHQRQDFFTKHDQPASDSTRN